MAELLHIPVHPNLKSRDVRHLIEAVRAGILDVVGDSRVR
jgi:hypothetical protein